MGPKCLFKHLQLFLFLDSSIPCLARVVMSSRVLCFVQSCARDVVNRHLDVYIYTNVELWIHRESSWGWGLYFLLCHSLHYTFLSCLHWALPKVDPEAKYLQVFQITPQTSLFHSLSLLPFLLPCSFIAFINDKHYWNTIWILDFRKNTQNSSFLEQSLRGKDPDVKTREGVFNSLLILVLRLISCRSKQINASDAQQSCLSLPWCSTAPFIISCTSAYIQGSKTLVFAGIPDNQWKKMAETQKLLLFVIFHPARVNLSFKTHTFFRSLLWQRVLGDFRSLKIETLIYKN